MGTCLAELLWCHLVLGFIQHFSIRCLNYLFFFLIPDVLKSIWTSTTTKTHCHLRFFFFFFHFTGDPNQDFLQIRLFWFPSCADTSLAQPSPTCTHAIQRQQKCLIRVVAPCKQSLNPQPTLARSEGIVCWNVFFFLPLKLWVWRALMLVNACELWSVSRYGMSRIRKSYQGDIKRFFSHFIPDFSIVF